MKTIFQKITAMPIGLLALASLLLSFTANRGGEGFQVYVDNKMVLEQFGKQLDNVHTLTLDRGNFNSQLSIRYYHCGKSGTNREITIRDSENRVLRNWKFADGNTASMTFPESSMACRVSDILAIQKTGNGKLGLYYTSNELPKGRLLAWLSINTGNNHQ